MSKNWFTDTATGRRWPREPYLETQNQPDICFSEVKFGEIFVRKNMIMYVKTTQHGGENTSGEYVEFFHDLLVRVVPPETTNPYDLED